MQPYALTVDRILDHAAKWSGEREIVTAGGGGPVERIGYGGLRVRANRLSGAFLSLGLRLGERIGTLAWNSQRHLEAYFGAMGAGLVCHTLNPRIASGHLAEMIDEAEDQVLVVSADLAPLAAELAQACPVIREVVVIDGEPPARLDVGRARIWDYESLLARLGASMQWGDFVEESPAGLCYTSGTTGRPKGVVYSHRSNYLHTLRALQADALALTAADVVLVAVPMFHANGWGLPFAGPAVGAKLVLPGRHLDGASLATLMRCEGVTVAVGVQTVWLGLLDHLDAAGAELPELRRVVIGGSRCPDGLLRRMESRLGARVQTSWGMTELSPMGTIAPPAGPPSQGGASGRPPLGVDLKLTNADGADLLQQRDAVGHLKVRGASVVDRYFRAEAEAVDADGWFDTGDLASVDEVGNLTIRGRSKELIKSGGEWINPVEIEDIVGRLPGVGQVAVIARPDPKWEERPMLVIEPRQGHALDAETVLDALRGKVPDWWLPDPVTLIEAMPLAATGKIDKNRLRADYVTREGVDEFLRLQGRRKG